MLYNVPPVIADIAPTTVARLAEIENVVGMKDSAPFNHLQDVVFRTRDRNFRVLCGVESHLVAALLLGAHGGTPSSGNLIPARFVELYEAAQSGRMAEAVAIQEEVNRFVQALEAFPSWFSTVKASLHLMGICGPTMAAPLPRLTSEETERLRGLLSEFGLLS